MTINTSENQRLKLQALGQMTSGITHDFNNLLSIIEGYTQVLQLQLNPDAATQEKLEAIMLATRRGTSMIQRLMAFGQEKNNRRDKDEGKSCDLVKTILDDKVLLRPVLGSRIELILRLPEQPVFIGCDEDSVTQILINLAINARASINSTGSVTIDVSTTNEQAILQFSDNGAALPAEKIAEVFRHSSLSPPALLPRANETEMGLGLIAQMMRQHQGSMDIQSLPGPGQMFGASQEKGTAFTLTFPRIALGQFLAGQPLTAGTKQFEDKTILVVDDEEALLPVLENQLGRLGMKVLKAANADSALLLQENYKGIIDFLLTDIAMPGMDGVQLAETMAGQRPKMGVVYMTGYIGRSDILNFLTPLPSDALVLPKPLRPEALSNILQQALEHVDEM